MAPQSQALARAAHPNFRWSASTARAIRGMGTDFTLNGEIGLLSTFEATSPAPLKAGPVIDGETGFPLGLTCRGTEPF